MRSIIVPLELTVRLAADARLDQIEADLELLFSDRTTVPHMECRPRRRPF
jgi:hypothetical protein